MNAFSLTPSSLLSKNVASLRNPSLSYIWWFYFCLFLLEQFIHWPILLYGPYFKVFLFVLDAPEHCGKSSNGWRLTSSTGNLTPRVVLTQPPPLPATDHGGKPLQRSDVRLDGSIAPLLVMAVPGAARYWQPAVSRSLLGRTNQRPTISFFGGVSLFSPGRSPRSRYLGFGFRQNSGNVLDEWVCSFQGAVRP